MGKLRILPNMARFYTKIIIPEMVMVCFLVFLNVWAAEPPVGPLIVIKLVISPRKYLKHFLEISICSLMQELIFSEV
jgi:hypothetical protein